MTRPQTFRIAVRKYSPFEHAIRARWQAFSSETQTKLQLDLVALDLTDLEHALFTSGGMVNGDWDIAFVATDWIAAMHAQRAAVDLAQLLNQDPPEGSPEAWTPSLLRLQRIGEAILGVPYHDGPECLVYRRDLFAQHGLTPPTTWQEFHQTARLLHNPAAGLYGTAFAAFPGPATTSSSTHPAHRASRPRKPSKPSPSTALSSPTPPPSIPRAARSIPWPSASSSPRARSP
jgi:multiple sugar transport system substrate-binding protein